MIWINLNLLFRATLYLRETSSSVLKGDKAGISIHARNGVWRMVQRPIGAVLRKGLYTLSQCFPASTQRICIDLFFFIHRPFRYSLVSPIVSWTQANLAILCLVMVSKWSLQGSEGETSAEGTRFPQKVESHNCIFFPQEKWKVKKETYFTLEKGKIS